MAVPARIFVGVTVFGLLATVACGAFATFLLTCQDKPSSTDVPESGCRVFPTGLMVLVVMATVFSGAFTYLAWRSLLGGARAAREARTRRSAGTTAPASPGPPRGDKPSGKDADDAEGDPPAGYT